MAKNNNITKAYGAAINKRVPIMLSLIGLLMILFTVGFFTANYYNHKPNPLKDRQDDENYIVVKSTREKISDEKFVISELYFKKFILEDSEEVPYDDGFITFEIKLGTKKDENIKGTNIAVKTYICYNWANLTFSGNTSVGLQKSTTYTANNIDATFDKRPVLFKKIDLQKDARFITTFEFEELKDGTSQKYVYYIEESFKDLVVSGTGGTSFTR